MVVDLVEDALQSFDSTLVADSRELVGHSLDRERCARVERLAREGRSKGDRVRLAQPVQQQQPKWLHGAAMVEGFGSASASMLRSVSAC
ncbi:hypothetical protein [Streptomyces sp. NPDC049915]|uniref:hypothetical protein n=1 Tax=Streptomyces sp. NPDC049915 TaxID=3155510 RepID=UPI00343AFAF9